MTPFPQTPWLPSKALGKGSQPREPPWFRGGVCQEAQACPAGGGRPDGAATTAPVAREDITDLAKATTEGGWTRATLPTVAALIQDAESDSVRPAEGLAVRGRRKSQGQEHLQMDRSSSLKSEPRSRPPGSPLSLLGASVCLAPATLSWQLHDSCRPPARDLPICLGPRVHGDGGTSLHPAGPFVASDSRI